MVDGTERQAVGPAAAEVGDVNVLHEEERIQKSIMFITSVLKPVRLPLLLSPLFKQVYKQMCKSSNTLHVFTDYYKKSTSKYNLFKMSK